MTKIVEFKAIGVWLDGGGRYKVWLNCGSNYYSSLERLRRPEAKSIRNFSSAGARDGV